MNGKKYAAAYIRVSTDDQVEYSPDTQLKCIAEFARKTGIFCLMSLFSATTE